MERGQHIPDFCINTYILTPSGDGEVKKNISNQFTGKDEFDLHFIDVDSDDSMIWKGIREVCKDAMLTNESLIIICRDDHIFTESYNKEILYEGIIDAAKKGAKILLGGIGAFGQAIPLSTKQFWIDSFEGTSFIVLFRSILDELLIEPFHNENTVDESLSRLTSHKMVILPFVSSKRHLNSFAHEKPIPFDVSEKRLIHLSKIARLYGEAIH